MKKEFKSRIDCMICYCLGTPIYQKKLYLVKILLVVEFVAVVAFEPKPELFVLHLDWQACALAQLKLLSFHLLFQETYDQKNPLSMAVEVVNFPTMYSLYFVVINMVNSVEQFWSITIVYLLTIMHYLPIILNCDLELHWNYAVLAVAVSCCL